jgi:hypothetical protein
VAIGLNERQRRSAASAELAVAPAFPLKAPIFNGKVYCTLGQIGN